MAIAITWEGDPQPHHVETIEMANCEDDFIRRALQQLYMAQNMSSLATVTIAPLATGGAMAVYKLTASCGSRDQTCQAVCKVPLERRIVYAAAGRDTTVETTTQLLDRLVFLAADLTQKAPGLFPRNGGVWHKHAPQDSPGQERHILVEEFIPGLSLERLRNDCEQRWTEGAISAETYRECRLGLDRLAVSTFTRLWNALGRRTFTSDPSPWNLLAVSDTTDGGIPHHATIIDLHSLEEDIEFSYVIQRLAAVYGLRQEILDHALLPGILDALGPEEGRDLLHATLPQLELEAEQTTKDLGVNLHQPLLMAIRAM